MNSAVNQTQREAWNGESGQRWTIDPDSRDVALAAVVTALSVSAESFVSDSGTIRTLGTYRGNPVVLSYNPFTSQVVVQAPDGAFVTGWRMSAAQLQHVIDSRSLGGG